MDFLSLAKQRFSCRKYLEKVPSDDLISEVLNIVRVAPSAKNLQPWKFIVINKNEALAEMKSTYGRSWIESAPIIIAACGNHEASWIRDDGKDHCDIDLAIAIDHLTLAATSKGLGTCWICKFDSGRAAELLKLPVEWEVVALIPIGFPELEADVERHEKLRKPLSDIVDYNRFISTYHS